MVAPALWGADQTLEFGLPQQQPLRKGYECQELIWEWSLEAHVGERGKERGKGVFTRSSPWGEAGQSGPWGLQFTSPHTGAFSPMAWGRDTALPEGAEGVSQGAQRTLGCQSGGPREVAPAPVTRDTLSWPLWSSAHSSKTRGP